MPLLVTIASAAAIENGDPAIRPQGVIGSRRLAPELEVLIVSSYLEPAAQVPLEIDSLGGVQGRAGCQQGVALGTSSRRTQPSDRRNPIPTSDLVRFRIEEERRLSASVPQANVSFPPTADAGFLTSQS
jgi:hypothetical protein